MTTTKLGSFTVFFENSEEYHHLKQEIFTHDLYYFEATTPQPVIIDAGAHIGLATLYFKKLYPQARIIALEPNPKLFALLEKNVFENQLSDVTLLPVALADTAGHRPFYIDATPNQWWSTGSFKKGAWTGQQQSDELMVATLPLAELITQPIDLLKLDIEAAEQGVLTASRDVLPLIKTIHLEYHSVRQQNLFVLSELLKEAGFSLHYSQDNKTLGTFNIKQSKGLIHVEAHRTC